MTSGEDFLGILFWLGGGLCCGLPLVGKSKDAPFVITSLLGEAVQVQTGKQAQTGRTMAIVFGAVGVAAICCGVLGALVALIGVLQK